jgi:hypothetical protein
VPVDRASRAGARSERRLGSEQAVWAILRVDPPAELIGGRFAITAVRQVLQRLLDRTTGCGNSVEPGIIRMAGCPLGLVATMSLQSGGDEAAF